MGKLSNRRTRKQRKNRRVRTKKQRGGWGYQKKTSIFKHQRSKYHHKGGYGQYQNNVPNGPTMSVGGLQPSGWSNALASPPPHTMLSRLVNGVDNYNHYTGWGTPSRN